MEIRFTEACELQYMIDEASSLNLRPADVIEECDPTSIMLESIDEERTLILLFISRSIGCRPKQSPPRRMSMDPVGLEAIESQCC